MAAELPVRAGPISARARTAGAARVESRAASRTTLFTRPLTSYYVVLGASLLLSLLGLVMVLSASSVKSYKASGSSLTVFNRQLVWFAIGLPLMWIAAHLKPRTFRWFAYPLLLLSLAGLVLVFVPGLGTTAYGATRWLKFGPVSAQPSELVKLALVLWGADLLVRKAKLLSEWRHLLVPLVPVLLVIAALVMAEPDMGTTLVVVSIGCALLFVVGTPLRMFGLLMSGFVGLLVALASFGYRLDRLTSFFHPFADKLGDGYQAVQGLYALGSGGWFGVGLGASRQKWNYLPNAHTDYIFAIIGEELGLVGTLVVLVLFALLAYAGLRIAQRTKDPFVRLAAAGVTTWIAVQAVVNMGAVTGLLPITGIPLPLVSFGGSSLAMSMFAMGMLASFAKTEPGAGEAMAARGPGVATRLRLWGRGYYGFAPAPRRRKPLRAARSAVGARARRR